ncbi:MAG: hypothetical protein GC178_04815 [Flavobacteriales bacterium]|nr:hypothetical protein [Flavobacteriales bacterium]
MENTRVLKILEIAWLIIGIGAVVMGAYQYNTYGWETAKWLFLGALIAGIFYATRRRMRMRIEADKKNREDKK